MSIITRGNTVHFTFSFLSEDDEPAVVISAVVQITYPGRDAYETETVELEQSGATWVGEWESTAARPCWVEYHAHAKTESNEFTLDGRFRLRGNRANLDHDALPRGSSSSDYP